MDYTFIKTDLTARAHQEALCNLVDDFGGESSKNRQPMSGERRESLIKQLRDFPTSQIFLASVDQQFCGMALCFQGFSTFAAKPLLNIHDFYIRPEFRGKGIGSSFLTYIEEEAVKLGCCKVTLEVLGANVKAQKLYYKMGFRGLKKEDQPDGIMYFLSKKCGG